MVKNVLELWRFRELLLALTFREIKVRYKQTFFGFAWAIFQPLALTVIFTVVFGIFLNVSSGSIPYPIFAYSALLPWTFFSTSVSFGALSVVNNGNLVSKVYFPREILPLASVGAAFFDFIIASFIFIALAVFFDVNFGVNIFYLILIVPMLLAFTLSMSLFLSCLNVLFRDMRFIVPLLLQIWLFLTPVIYPIEKIGDKFKLLIYFNPMALLIQSFREATILNRAPSYNFLLLSLVSTLAAFTLSYWLFKAKEKIFADVI